MRVAPRGDLGQVGHDENLMRPGEAEETVRDPVRHLAPDARVDLVEDEDGEVVHLDERRLQREHEPTRLAAGGDAAQRGRRKAGVQRH